MDGDEGQEGWGGGRGVRTPDRSAAAEGRASARQRRLLPTHPLLPLPRGAADKALSGAEEAAQAAADKAVATVEAGRAEAAKVVGAAEEKQAAGVAEAVRLGHSNSQRRGP